MTETRTIKSPHTEPGRTMYENWRSEGTAALRSRIARGEPIAAADFALFLKANAGRPIPDDLNEFLIERLLKGFKGKRGRRTDPNLGIRDLFMIVIYNEELAAARAEARADKARGARTGGPSVHAHDRTAEELSRLFGVEISGETVRNRLSEINTGKRMRSRAPKPKPIE